MSGDVAEIAQISFYLAKPDQTLDTVLSDEKDIYDRPDLKLFEFDVEDAAVQFFYFETITPKTNPKWLDFINEKIKPDEQIVFEGTTRSPNGLLLISVNNHIFAATFGRSAVSYLDDEAFEADFGIKTAMNMCGNEEIRQTRSQSNTVIPTQIDRQVGRPSDTFVFGLSEAEDLRYISAHIKGEEKVTLQGRSNLTVKVNGGSKFNWEDLVNRCNLFYEAYNGEDYLELFPNYRNLREASKREIEALNDKLILALQESRCEKMQLGIPEFVAEDTFSFTYTNYPRRENIVYSYLDICHLFEIFNIEDVNISKLRSRRVYLFSADEDRVLSYKNWRIFNCLTYELELDGKYFVLTDGRWLEVERDFYQSIMEFAQSDLCIEPCEPAFAGIDISDVDRRQNREDIFNQKVCEIRPEAILFDKAQLKIGAGRANKEFCDVLDFKDDRTVRIIHCKKYKDSTAASSLFSQAFLYSSAFVQDPVFLNDIREYISESDHPFSDQYLSYIDSDIASHNGAKYDICLWFLYDRRHEAPAPENIPLMALYELKLMHDHLRNSLKFKAVILRFIPVQRVHFSKPIDPPPRG
ncbi:MULTISPECIES: DUF6119 family protein [unclassified Pseudovibrio]|uniref:DUF6119 family protein n=1 Tax=unclassified Pseudovibrio TaxID=2627060 RepID=UPI0007AE94C2|nr:MULTISPECIES: DUF6119 family protein [unclassified Pseudovibrio]KZL04051.1 hypothetical protein PsW74_00086 [Pseudovibrio sp. W74]KZL04270.1 hypothetical protein PsAD14_05331 [Pseudovibrio sp. Ad14]